MWYLISAPAAGTLVMNVGSTQISVAYSAGQTAFYALSASAEYGDGCVISGPFAKAPAGNGNGGGELPASPEVTELVDYTAATLEDGRVYHIGVAPDGGFNMTGLNVAPNATARIWVDAGTGGVVFPDEWVWSDSSEFQLPAGYAGGVGDFVDGETYLITVCRYKYGERDFVLAHRALTIKPAQA